MEQAAEFEGNVEEPVEERAGKDCDSPVNIEESEELGELNKYAKDKDIYRPLIYDDSNQLEAVVEAVRKEEVREYDIKVIETPEPSRGYRSSYLGGYSAKK